MKALCVLADGKFLAISTLRITLLRIMNKGSQPIFWYRLRKAAPVVSAATLFVTALAGGTGWVAGYFAKEGEMQDFRCLAELRIELLDLRSRTGNLYARYLNTKIEIERLSRSTTEEGQIEMHRRQGQQELFWKELMIVRAKATALSERIQTGRCEE